MLSTFGTRKSIALPFVSTGAMLTCLSLLMSACLIIEVDIDEEVNGNSVIVLRIVVQENTADVNPWRGVQMVLVPDDWIFNSGTYDASDINGFVGTGLLVESADWADSAAIGVYPAPVGMKWIGLISDAAYSHGDTLLMETNVEFLAGMKVGTFPVGIVVTKENFFPSTGDWFGTGLSTIVGADSAMTNYVTVNDMTICEAQSEIPQIECEALVALYDSTGGTGWTNRTGWKATATPCSWYGVICSSDHVQQLNLPNNALAGPMPLSLGNLSDLSWLNLASNSLTGQIPSSLGNLTSCTGFHLSGNNLIGPIPAWLGSMTQLGWLDLSNNGLTGSIPESMGNMTGLAHLYLYANGLTGEIPSPLGNLAGIQGLGLHLNGLTGTVPLPVAKMGSLASSGCWFTDNDPSLCVPDILPYQTLAVGGFICGLPLDPGCDPIIHVDAKVFMEGSYSGGAMVGPPAFSNYLPTTQPYSDPFFNGTPLDHDNPDVVPLTPDSVLDWVLVSLRADPTAASEVIGSERTAFLLENGSIVDTSGTTLAFPGVTPAGYHLVIRHRNHASVMSADTLDLSDGLGSWNFTTSTAQAYTAGGSPMKDLVDGSFGMFACDANADGQVTAPDFNMWNAATTAGETGYRQADCNMDGQVTAPDFNLWNANTVAGASSKVPE